MRVVVFHLRSDASRDVRYAASCGEVVPLVNFDAVAVLEADSLGAAFEASNHVHGDWTKVEGVKLLTLRPLRSTSVGDLLETPEGCYVVGRCNFSRVNNLKALMAEAML